MCFVLGGITLASGGLGNKDVVNMLIAWGIFAQFDRNNETIIILIMCRGRRMYSCCGKSSIKDIYNITKYQTWYQG